MSLSRGTRLGAYEIHSLLGAGGMGEVYRARDTRLGREVAIKALPDPFSGDRERLARFEREARVLAALNHPNIAAIYGLEERGADQFLVLELVPGATLADRLAAGPLSLDETVAIARQIALALEAAHEKGIVHRDLKPANIMLTPDDRVKVLDFGLAKPLTTTVSSPDLSHPPTVTNAGSQDGVILGTVEYMSPEQVRGKGVDRRSDIWSFGCVLFEMLAGRKPFQAPSLFETFAVILRNDPDWAALPQPMPESILSLVRRCLRKDPGRRLQDIGDARVELEDASNVAFAAPAPASLTPGAAARPPMRLSLALPPSAPLAVGDRPALAISPDGRHLVYVARLERGTQLFLRPMDRLEAVPIAGTEGGSGPFFSPDGQWIGFVAGDRLSKVPIRGGAPLTMCDVSPETRGASWGPDDEVVFAPTPASGLARVAAAGGVPSPLSSLEFDEGERTHRWPESLPHAKAVLFTVGRAGAASFDEAAIAMHSRGDGARRILVERGTHPRWSPTGHLIYARSGVLLAAPFDPGRLALTGPAVPIADGVMTEATGAAQFALSAAGLLIYAPGRTHEVRRSLVWVDREGAVEPLALAPRAFEEPRLSPDGERLAFGSRGTKNDIWVYEPVRGTLARLTFEADNFAPLWSPDGTRLTFSSNRDGPSNIFWKLADGSGAEERLVASEYDLVGTSWSPDGRILAFTEYHPKTGGDIWMLSLGDEAPRPFRQTPFNEYGAAFSPDGRWLAYTSDETGRGEVYVTGFPGPRGKWQISTDGGAEPIWTRDGTELCYRAGASVVAVPVTVGGAFATGTPRVVVDGQYERGTMTGLPNYDVAPDGRRFVLITEAEPRPAPTLLTVITDWASDLTRPTP